MATAIVRATPQMSERISELVHTSFSELAAADWAPEARRVFLAESSPASIALALQAPAFAAVVESGSAVTGFILIRSPSNLDMLFVHPRFLRQGIARRLWEAARREVQANFSDVKSVEVNATPYAVNAYRALGFVPISPPFTRGGCIAIRMTCPLSVHTLDASAL